VKCNHVEKTNHPCQFPVELIERLILAMTMHGDWVFDPFLGTGTTVIAAIRNDRRGAGAEIVREYAELARNRIKLAAQGRLGIRPMDRPVFDPRDAGASLTTPPWAQKPAGMKQQAVFRERSAKYRKAK
jgi:adenine-specific DNA-methyltransferase